MVTRWPPTKSWESSLDHPTERVIDALWNFAAQQNGKNIVQLEDVLKIRDFNHS